MATARAAGWIKPDAGHRQGRRQGSRHRPGVPQPLPGRLLPWIDAAVVLDRRANRTSRRCSAPAATTAGSTSPPTSTSSCSTVLDAQPKGTRTVLRRARGTCWPAPETERLAERPVGQFDPAAAGGPGVVAVRRGGVAGQPVGVRPAGRGRAAVRRRARRGGTSTRPAGPRCRSPVRFSPDGSASGAAGEESRGEVWAPVWRRAVHAGGDPAAVRRGPGILARPARPAGGRLLRRDPDARRRAGHRRVHPLRAAAAQRAGVRRGPARPGRGPRTSPRCGWPPGSRTGSRGSAAPRRLGGGRHGRCAASRPLHLRLRPRRRPAAAGRDARRAHRLEQAVGRSGRTGRGPRAGAAAAARDFLAVLTSGASAANCGSRSASPPARPGPAPDARAMRAACGRSCSRSIRRCPATEPADGRWRDAPLVPGLRDPPAAAGARRRAGLAQPDRRRRATSLRQPAVPRRARRSAGHRPCPPADLHACRPLAADSDESRAGPVAARVPGAGLAGRPRH